MRALHVLIIGLLFVCWPVNQASAQDAGQYYHLPPEKMFDYIKSEEGRRRAVFIYASWCPHCRNKMPAIMNLEKAYAGTVIPVSVDQNPHQLKHFLSNFDDVPFPVFMLKETRRSILERALGAPPRSGIPYTILLDENNNVHKAGNFRIKTIVDYVLPQDGEG